MLRKSFLMLMLLCMSVCVFAVENQKVLLVIDAKNEPVLPKNFHTTSDPLPANQTVDTKGLEKLHIAGGAQFSEQGLKKIKERIPGLKLIVDLRKESHGFIDGNAVSWYGPENAANCGKNYDDVIKTEKQLLDALRASPAVTLYEIVSKSDGKITKTKSIVVSPHDIADEKTVTKRNHLYYMRLVVNDHLAPETQEVDDFINAVRKIPRGIWLFFHCRGGAGRTTTFMVMYDIMRNAKEVSFEDILKRQKLLGGEDLENFGKLSDVYKSDAAKQRFKFLTEFYQYARTNNDRFKTPWSEWSKQQKIKFENACYRLCQNGKC